MSDWVKLFVLTILGLATLPTSPHAEILAMMNYETKSAAGLRALRTPVAPMDRREGLAIIDVDPASPNYGNIVQDIPLPNNLVAHHVFINNGVTKAYVTALGQSVLHVIDLRQQPYVLRPIETPGCMVQEDVVFSRDDRTWYLTCMGTQNVVVGDGVADRALRSIAVKEPYPHGIAIHEGIDRMLVSSTVRPSDMGDQGDAVSVVELSTGRQLNSVRVSNKAAPGREAPVEILFVPNSNPPAAYVTNLAGGSLWLLTWDPARKDFTATQAFDFTKLKAGIPLEMYFNRAGDRFYVTTANPGHLHIFDLGAGLAAPRLQKSIVAAGGAHHVSITADERLAFVQNALLNLPGMSDGSITVIDLVKGERIGSVDTLKNTGFNPNSMVLLPKWYHAMGH